MNKTITLLLACVFFIYWLSHVICFNFPISINYIIFASLFSVAYTYSKLSDNFRRRQVSVLKNRSYEQMLVVDFAIS